MTQVHKRFRGEQVKKDKRLPISGYNYAALRDRLKRKGIEVSVTTVIDRAKGLDCSTRPPRSERPTTAR